MLSCFSHVWHFVRLLCPWDFSGKTTRVGCHALLQGNVPDSEIEPVSLMSPTLAGKFLTTSATWESPTQPYGWVFLLSFPVSWCLESPWSFPKAIGLCRDPAKTPDCLVPKPLSFSYSPAKFLCENRNDISSSSWAINSACDFEQIISISRPQFPNL